MRPNLMCNTAYLCNLGCELHHMQYAFHLKTTVSASKRGKSKAHVLISTAQSHPLPAVIVIVILAQTTPLPGEVTISVSRPVKSVPVTSDG